jgi:Fe-S-cluster containining protein
MFDGIFKSMEYGDYLEREKYRHNSAEKLGKKECQKCGFCCLQRPCNPTVEEFYKIAEFLKMTPEKCAKKYFVIDSFSTGGIKFLFAAKTEQLDITGKYISYDRTYDKGYCVFFNKKKGCKLQSVKPEQAKKLKCWKGDEEKGNPYIETWKNFDWSKLGITKEDLSESDNDDSFDEMED